MMKLIELCLTVYCLYLYIMQDVGVVIVFGAFSRYLWRSEENHETFVSEQPHTCDSRITKYGE